MKDLFAQQAAIRFHPPSSMISIAGMGVVQLSPFPHKHRTNSTSVRLPRIEKS